VNISQNAIPNKIPKTKPPCEIDNTIYAPKSCLNGTGTAPKGAIIVGGKSARYLGIHADALKKLNNRV